MNQPIPIFLNIKAGFLKATPQIEQIQEMARSIDLNVDVIIPNNPAHLRKLVRENVASGAKKIGVAGGDGTVALAVQELAHSQTKLAILPMGTANNFATALHLPIDLPSSLRVLKEGEVRQVSLGKIGNRYFTEAAGVGLFADALSFYGSGTNKNLFKALTSLARLLLNFQRYQIELIVDGQKYKEKAILCTVANSFRFASAIPIAPQAKLTNDNLVVVILGDIHRREVWKYLMAIRSQLHLNLPKVTTLTAQHITIKCKHKLNVHADDQIIGTTPVDIEVQPKALKVLVDRL